MCSFRTGRKPASLYVCPSADPQRWGARAAGGLAPPTNELAGLRSFLASHRVVGPANWKPLPVATGLLACCAAQDRYRPGAG